jgi:hypothetical protein
VPRSLLVHFGCGIAQTGSVWRGGRDLAAANGGRMRAYSTKEKLRITAGAVTALVIVGWLAVVALTLLATP